MSLFPPPATAGNAITKATVRVILKDEVLDPQGKAVLSVLKSSGYNNIEDVRVGKHIELTIRQNNIINNIDKIDNIDAHDGNNDNGAVNDNIDINGSSKNNMSGLTQKMLSKELKDISEKILSNPIIENFNIEINN